MPAKKKHSPSANETASKRPRRVTVFPSFIRPTFIFYSLFFSFCRSADHPILTPTPDPSSASSASSSSPSAVANGKKPGLRSRLQQIRLLSFCAKQEELTHFVKQLSYETELCSIKKKVRWTKRNSLPHRLHQEHKSSHQCLRYLRASPRTDFYRPRSYLSHSDLQTHSDRVGRHLHWR